MLDGKMIARERPTSPPLRGPSSGSTFYRRLHPSTHSYTLSAVETCIVRLQVRGQTTREMNINAETGKLHEYNHGRKHGCNYTVMSLYNAVLYCTVQ